MSRRKKKNNKKSIWAYPIFIVLVAITYIILGIIEKEPNKQNNVGVSTENNINLSETSYNLEDIPAYIGEASININNNVPFFKKSDFTEEPFEKYSPLNNSRCGVAFANVCIEIMPKKGEERKSLSNVKNLSGWVQKTYPNIIGTRYLYNRCHLIGWQLSAENDNIQNLMTGTAYLNYEMLEYENKVAEYIKDNEANNYHVLYRVTPIFEGNNKLASRSRNRGTISRK